MKNSRVKPVFYTMLYVKIDSVKENLAENSKSNLQHYTDCCEALTNSLKLQGYNLIVLTNKKNILEELNKNIEVKEIEFHLKINKNIKFYAAHYKIDVFKYLSTVETYAILLDSDIVCINEMPINLKFLIAKNVPVYYDITKESYPSYGRDVIVKDKSFLMDKSSIGNWAGGEFVGGDTMFYAELYRLCMKYWETYMANYQDLHHQGDEMLTSCALEEYQLNGNFLFDIGTVGVISRFWSSSTLHVQNDFKAYLDNFLLHLPADKNMIASHKDFKPEKFISEYSKYLKVKKIENYFKKTIKKMLGK